MDNMSVRIRRIKEAAVEAVARFGSGRAFITSYQKSGTHQIMPMFAPNIKSLLDASHIQFTNMPDCYNMSKEVNEEEKEKTVERLKSFDGMAFGHVAYMPEFADAIQARPTRVLFNTRDPRDVVVAEYERIASCYQKGIPQHGWLNYHSTWGGEAHWLFEGPDPLMQLIEIAAARWPTWLGWLDHGFVMQVKFEELRLNRIETIAKVREFIAMYGAPDFDRMVERASPRPKNPTFRKGAVGEWKNYFEARHVKAVEKLMPDVFERLGYEL